MKKQNNKGFTIIEVVLVLAIAGLIFLIVFLALPQLQRSRRDTQRKSDAGRMLAALESRASNNNGAYPDADDPGWTGFAGAYLPVDEYQDPQNGPYGVSPNGTDITYNVNLPGPNPGDLVYGIEHICDGEELTQAGASLRDAAIAMRLEQGIYCVDNR